MIRQLLSQAVELLRDGFTGVFADPVAQIELGPVTVPAVAARPHLVLSALDLRISQMVNDDGSSQPRTLESREAIPVNLESPAGPYTLAQSPLEDTVEVRVVYFPNTVDEYSEPLMAGADFSVDWNAGSVSILADISTAGTLRFVYSYVGVATVREFEQQFVVDYYAADHTLSGLHMGLVTTILQTQHEALLENFNFGNPSNFSGNGYTNLVTLRRINALELQQVETVAVSDVRQRLLYNTIGMMRMSRSLEGGFGIISSIHTRGQNGPGVNVVPNLG